VAPPKNELLIVAGEPTAPQAVVTPFRTPLVAGSSTLQTWLLSAVQDMPGGAMAVNSDTTVPPLSAAWQKQLHLAPPLLGRANAALTDATTMMAQIPRWQSCRMFRLYDLGCMELSFFGQNL
jgi:hypothetical protein